MFVRVEGLNFCGRILEIIDTSEWIHAENPASNIFPRMWAQIVEFVGWTKFFCKFANFARDFTMCVVWENVRLVEQIWKKIMALHRGI